MKVIIANQKIVMLGKVNLPDIGTIEVPSDGKIQIESDELADIIVSNNPDFSFENQVVVNGGKVDEDDEKIDYEAMTIDELVEVIKAAGLPEAEWEKLSKNEKNPKGLLINYIKKKLKK